MNNKSLTEVEILNLLKNTFKVDESFSSFLISYIKQNDILLTKESLNDLLKQWKGKENLFTTSSYSSYKPKVKKTVVKNNTPVFKKGTYNAVYKGTNHKWVPAIVKDYYDDNPEFIKNCPEFNNKADALKYIIKKIKQPLVWETEDEWAHSEYENCININKKDNDYTTESIFDDLINIGLDLFTSGEYASHWEESSSDGYVAYIYIRTICYKYAQYLSNKVECNYKIQLFHNFPISKIDIMFFNKDTKEVIKQYKKIVNVMGN